MWDRILKQNCRQVALFGALIFKKANFEETVSQENSRKIGSDYQNQPIGTNKCLIRNNASKAPNM